MNTNHPHAAAASAGLLEPVAPSWMVRVIMRPMTKVLNPVMATLAGKRHFGGAARLSHTGRRSGRPYVAIVGAHITGDAAVIPLTFGNTSDWARNVRAAGGCSIRLNGCGRQAPSPCRIQSGVSCRFPDARHSPVPAAHGGCAGPG